MVGFRALTVKKPSEVRVHPQRDRLALAGRQGEGVGGGIDLSAGPGLAHDLAPGILRFQQDFDAGALGEQVVRLQQHVDHWEAGGDPFRPLFVEQFHAHPPRRRLAAGVEPRDQHRHDRLGEGNAAVKVQMSGAVGSHAARNGDLSEIAPDAQFLGADHQVVAVGDAVAQQQPVVGVDRPMPLGLHADIARFRLRVQEEAVIGGDDRVGKAEPAQFVQGGPDQFQGAGNQAQRGFRVAFELAVDLGRAQHQQVHRGGQARLAAHEFVQRQLGETVA